MNSAVLYTPSPESIPHTHWTKFARYVTQTHRLSVETAQELYRWSIESPVLFWRALWDWLDLPHDGNAEPVLVFQGIQHSRFFPGIRLNLTETLLTQTRCSPSTVVLSSRQETGDGKDWTLSELRHAVAQYATGLRMRGIRRGDRVVAIVRNDGDAVIAALATLAIGAIWSSVAPDLGKEAILSRFTQLQPALMFAHAHQRSSTGGRFPSLSPVVADVIVTLTQNSPNLHTVVVLDSTEEITNLPQTVTVIPAALWADLPASPLDYDRVPFDHPAFVLFSSGTTGPPKGIVHGHGGTVLEHHKELLLHTNLGPGDTLYFHTSCGWMMWNWQLSALATGARIVVYDGQVASPEKDSLLELIRREKVSVFGTSPAYIQYCMFAGVEPKRWPELRSVLSTGSPLFGHQFDWIAEKLGPVAIDSISGGTDILGCFFLGCPIRPTVRGLSPMISLGMNVKVADGDTINDTGHGELVCVAPFPSRPVGMWGDADGARFSAAYFTERPGCWSHGDWVEIHEDARVRVIGRCDGVMNIHGVRIGPAELYPIILGFDGIEAAAAVDQDDPTEPGGKRLVVFVVMQPGVTLDRPLTLKIKKALRDGLSQNHVPKVITAVSALPTTFSGKISERAIADVLHGRPLRNRTAIRNPESLTEIGSLALP